MDMPPDIETVIEGIDFRVLIELEEDGLYVAHCLQTGAVAEGATAEEAEGLIKAILENDFRRAIQLGSIEGLLSTPAPYEFTVRWYEIKAANPEGVRHVPLAISVGALKRDVQSEVRISTRAKKTHIA
jgi:predicted RNase H-like HicB family nuclease